MGKLSEFWYGTLKKIFFREVYQKIDKMGDIQPTLDLAIDASQRLVESAEQFKTIQESAEQISKISKENKTNCEEFQVGIKQSRQLNKDLINQFLITNNKQTNKFMNRLTYHTNEKNVKLLERILETNNQQILTFIEQISHKLEK